MKTRSSKPIQILVPAFCGRGGFTLPELQATLVIFVIVIGGVMATYLFGLRLFEYIRPKLDASDQARNFVGKMSAEVKSATEIDVGTGDFTSFTGIPINTLQIGNSIQIYPTTDTNIFIRYFWNASDQTVRRIVSSNSVAFKMASGVTNQFIFSSLDYAGNVLTNNQNNRVIGMSLKFYQREVGPSSSAAASDFCQLRTRITRRSLL